LKSKASERDKRKREMYRGELKRRDLRYIILSSGEKGVTVGQIRDQLSKYGKAISKQQVHNYLNESQAKKLFYKKGNRYFMKHVVTYDDWSIFSKYINRLQYFSNFKNLWRGREFQSEFHKNSLENILFQFSNHIGALLTYIMIEALRPTETFKLIQDRKKISIEFVRDAISPEYLLQTFLAALPYDFREKYRIGGYEIITDKEGKNKKSIANLPEINELHINGNQNPLQDLIDAYNEVYPHLHDLLESNFRKNIDRNRGTCKHDNLEPINIHKIGAGYKCNKCSRIMLRK
jgi:hypothetical protein